MTTLGQLSHRSAKHLRGIQPVKQCLPIEQDYNKTPFLEFLGARLRGPITTYPLLVVRILTAIFYSQLRSKEAKYLVADSEH